MENRISDFLQKQTNLTICTVSQTEPYCANCFFVWDSVLESIIIKSSKDTRHITEALTNNHVAGTILPDEFQIGKIKGIQYSGNFKIPTEEELTHCKEKYYNKFPLARLIPGDIWLINLTRIKMTDNTLGFGKKLIWERQQ